MSTFTHRSPAGNIQIQLMTTEIHELMPESKTRFIAYCVGGRVGGWVFNSSDKIKPTRPIPLNWVIV